MSSGGGKGGSTKSSVTLPQWLEDPAKRNLARAEQAAQVGYMPWYGPDVAAATPQQLSAMKASHTAAQAFGLAPKDQAFDSGLPQAQEFAGGVQGYSSAPLFEQALGELRAKNPDQMAKYDSLYNNQYLNQNPSTAGKYTNGLLNAAVGGGSGAYAGSGSYSGYGPSSTSYTGYSDSLAANGQTSGVPVEDRGSYSGSVSGWSGMSDTNTNSDTNSSSVYGGGGFL